MIWDAIAFWRYSYDVTPCNPYSAGLFTVMVLILPITGPCLPRGITSTLYICTISTANFNYYCIYPGGMVICSKHTCNHGHGGHSCVQGTLLGLPRSSGYWLGHCMYDVSGRRTPLKMIWSWLGYSCLNMANNRNVLIMWKGKGVIEVYWHLMRHMVWCGRYLHPVLGSQYRTSNPPEYSQYGLNIALGQHNRPLQLIL